VHADVVNALVDERLRAGTLLDATDLYTANPLLPILVAPLGVVPKATPGKFRLVLDGSSGVADCVNDFCDASTVGEPLALASFDSIIDRLIALRAAAPTATILLYSTDLDNAYQSVAIRADDWWQLGMVWRGRVLLNTAAPFGLRSSGHWLYQFTFAFDRRILELTNVPVSTYVDDSLACCYEKDMPAVAAAMHSVPESCGFMISTKDGNPPPGTSRAFCGWLFDSASMTVSLPPAKLTALRALVAGHATRRRILRSDLVTLVGKLHGACRGLRSSRPYVDSLDRASAASTGRWVVLPLDARADLRHFASVLSGFSGVRLLAPPARTVTVYTDACTSLGWGFVCHDLGVYGYGSWADDPDIAPPLQHINALELLVGAAASALVATLTPGGTGVTLYMDNKTAVASITKMRGAGGALSNAIRCLDYLSDTAPFHLSSAHVKGVDNVTADSLSRGAVPPHLLPLRRLFLPPRFLSLMASSRSPSSAILTLLG
jgi:hypothetical protein